MTRSIRLDERREIHVERKAVKGRQVVDLRVYDKTGPSFFPTSQGISCPVELLEELISALQSLSAARKAAA